MLAYAGNRDVANTSDSMQGRADPPPSSPRLESVTLLSALKLDPRPTFVIDLEHLESSTCVLFSNPALETRPNLCHTLKTASQIPTSYEVWAQPVVIHGLEWNHYTIEGKWRVLSAGPSTVDILAPWTASTAHRSTGHPACPEEEEEGRLRSNSPSLKRKSSGRENTDRMPSPLALTSMPQGHEHFLGQFDFDSMPLGPITGWPRQLQEWFFMILVDPRPALLFWGDCSQSGGLIFLYNEAHAEVLGDQHPSVMGMPLQRAFPLSWEEFNKTVLEQIVKTKRPTMHASMLVTHCKNGAFLEERYYDWTTLPILSDGSLVGIYESLLDVTHNILEQNRSKINSEISSIITNSELDNIWDRLTEKFLDNKDTPQVLVYSLSSAAIDDPERLLCKLEGSIGCKQSVALESFQLDSPEHDLAKLFRHSLECENPLYLSRRKSYARTDLWLQVSPEDPRQNFCRLLSTLLNEFKKSPLGDTCDSIVILPIKSNNSQNIRGFVVIGLNPRASYDTQYQSFIALLQQTITATISSALRWREDRMLSKKAEVAHADLSAQLLRSTQETKAIESRFSQLARQAPIGICIYSADGAMAFANKMWYTLTAFKEGSDTKSPGWWAPIVYPDDMAIAFASFSKLQDDKQTVHFEIRLAVASKQYPFSAFTWVLVSAYPEKRDGEDLESIVACFTDITEQKWAAEIERKRTQDALEAKRQQESFIDVTSHEIRNPLSVALQCSEEISSIAGAWLRNLPQHSTKATLPISELEDILNAAEVVEQCTLHQRRMVDGILTLSKMEGGMLPFNLSPSQATVVVENTLKIFSREFLHSGIEITLRQDSSLERASAEFEWLELDPGRLSQMIINLLTNAIKFTKTQVQRRIELTIGVSKTQQPLDSFDLTFLPVLDHANSRIIGAEWSADESVYLHVSVTDSGKGISTEDQETVFSRFSQGCSQDYAQYTGSGLGLYICRALVEIHGGRIGLKSRIGQGSTFGFCLKTRRVPDPEIKFESSSPRKNSLNGNGVATARYSCSSVFNVLIVEDNPINQLVLSKQLKKTGHSVTVANNGQECLDILNESHFCKPDGNGLSLILMDIEMPVMNGVDCTMRIRDMEAEMKVNGHVPIIATTGNARNEKVELIKAAGVDRVILKPYSVSDLLRLVDELLLGDETYN